MQHKEAPGPGTYDGHLKPFGIVTAVACTPTMGRKYKDKPNKNPGPGAYEAAKAKIKVLPRPTSPLINESRNMTPRRIPFE